MRKANKKVVPPEQLELPEIQRGRQKPDTLDERDIRPLDEQADDEEGYDASEL